MVAISDDGYDEISPCVPTTIAEILEDGEYKTYRIDPKDFGIPSVDPEDLAGGTGVDNFNLALDVLNGKGPGHQVCLRPECRCRPLHQQEGGEHQGRLRQGHEGDGRRLRLEEDRRSEGRYEFVRPAQSPQKIAIVYGDFFCLRHFYLF